MSNVCLCFCITSPNYPENYAPDGSYVIKLVSLLTLDVKDFRTEVMWDTMVVNGQNYSESNRPVGFRKTVRSLVFQMELVMFDTLIEPAMYVGIQLSCLFTFRDRR